MEGRGTNLCKFSNNYTFSFFLFKLWLDRNGSRSIEKKAIGRWKESNRKMAFILASKRKRKMPWEYSQTRIQPHKKYVSSYPSFCPNPEPGTVEMPVASKSLRQ